MLFLFLKALNFYIEGLIQKLKHHDLKENYLEQKKKTEGTTEEDRKKEIKREKKEIKKQINQKPDQRT